MLKPSKELYLPQEDKYKTVLSDLKHITEELKSIRNVISIRKEKKKNDEADTSRK